MNVWIDIDNAPHVAFFAPLIRELRAEGATVRVTARDRTFVPGLLDGAGIAYDIIGRGQPSGFLAKAGAIGWRALELARWARGRGLDVAVGHGSRALPIAARLVRVPNLTTFDYEHVQTGIFERFCDRIVVPRVVLDARASRSAKWSAYDGFKEEAYLSPVPADTTIRADLGVPDDHVLLVIRPPSRSAHYHDAASEAILASLLKRLENSEKATAVWLRRNPHDAVPGGSRIISPSAPVDGIALASAADLVVSGGGTMTREAALLGTPSYSIFTGPVGAVDAELTRRGWLRPVRSAEDVAGIPL